MTSVATCSRPDLTKLPANSPILSLYLRKVECIDETEHEGIWPFVGEWISNDAIRLKALITWQRGSDAPQAQCWTPVLDLGSNYQDGTVQTFNERLAVYPSTSQNFPLTVNVSMVLIEEDWGGQLDEVAEKIFHDIGKFIKDEVATATSAAVSSAVGAAIGSVFGPIGTAVGSGIGAAVGWIIQQIGKGLDDLKSDAFPPQDLSIVLSKPAKKFTSDIRLIQPLEFEEFGGRYRLTFEWRFGYADRKIALKTHKGNYVMAINGGGEIVNATSRQTIPHAWEMFTLEDVASRQVCLRSHNGQLLTAEGGGGGVLIANRNIVGRWETFTIYNLGDNKIALRAQNGKFLCAENGGGGELLFNRERVAEWETFTLEFL